MKVTGNVKPLFTHKWFSTGNINFLNQQIRELIADIEQLGQGQFIFARITCRGCTVFTTEIARKSDFKADHIWKPFKFHEESSLKEYWNRFRIAGAATHLLQFWMLSKQLLFLGVGHKVDIVTRSQCDITPGLHIIGEIQDR